MITLSYSLNNPNSDFHNAFSDISAPKPRGGVSCFIKDSFIQNIEKVEKNISEIIIVRIKGGAVLFGSYIPPVDSPYFNITDFCKIANMFTPESDEKVIVGGGDLNSRVGNMMLYGPHPDMSYRKNEDTVMNAHGKGITENMPLF